MKKLALILAFLAIIPVVFSITPEDTPCQSYTTLYYGGGNLSIDQFCLLRMCLEENRSAQFYFKYAQSHKEKMRFTLVDFETGLVEWSNGIKTTFEPNETKMMDIDKNGYYDQKIWYEIKKNYTDESCFKIYEVLESKNYKVPSPNELFLLNKTSTTSRSNATANVTNSITISNTTVSNTSSASSANNTIVEDNGNITIRTQPEIGENAVERTEQAEPRTENNPVRTAETKEIAKTEAQKETTFKSLSKENSVKGITLTVVVIAIILGIFFYVEKSRKKNKFKLEINENIGKIELEKKKDKEE